MSGSLHRRKGNKIGDKMVRFVFDLDGTVTSEETLPIIASHFKIEEDMKKLTSATVAGNIPFVESFIKRVHMMSSLPVDEVSKLLEKTPLYPQIAKFIREHNNNCVITTGNLRCWVDRLCDKVGCRSFTSEADVKNNQVTRLTRILRKETIVREFQNRGNIVVFIGEGNNDLEAMRMANISIASALTHRPANTILSITDYVVYEEEALCRQLNQLL